MEEDKPLEATNRGWYVPLSAPHTRPPFITWARQGRSHDGPAFPKGKRPVTKKGEGKKATRKSERNQSAAGSLIPSLSYERPLVQRGGMQGLVFVEVGKTKGKQGMHERAGKSDESRGVRKRNIRWRK